MTGLNKQIWECSMNRLKIITLIVLVLALSRNVQAYEILVVQSSRAKAYQDVLQGVSSVVPSRIPVRGVKSIYPHTVKSIVLSDSYQDGKLEGIIKSFSPDLILAIGHKALNRVKDFRQQPIVYLMVLFPASDIRTRTNITGIDMNISPARQLSALISTFPDIKKVGLVFDPIRTGEMVASFKQAAQELGISIVSREVHSPSEVPDVISDEMANGIDSFCLLPDRTVLTTETLPILHSLAFQNKVPVLAFADKYLQYGATVSVAFDIFEMGKQAGEMVRQILTGTEISEIPVTPVEKITVSLNPN